MPPLQSSPRQGTALVLAVFCRCSLESLACACGDTGECTTHTCKVPAWKCFANEAAFEFLDFLVHWEENLEVARGTVSDFIGCSRLLDCDLTEQTINEVSASCVMKAQHRELGQNYLCTYNFLLASSTVQKLQGTIPTGSRGKELFLCTT